MIDLNFTHYWDEEDIERARPMIREVLEDLPEIQYEEIRIGTTGSADGRFHRQRNTKHDLYIQLNPQKLNKFTIAHELHHFFTRERAVDLRTLAMGRKYFDGEPYYLSEIEGCGDLSWMMKNYPEKVEKWAREALSQSDVDPVHYFKNRMIERSEFRDMA